MVILVIIFSLGASHQFYFRTSASPVFSAVMFFIKLHTTASEGKMRKCVHCKHTASASGATPSFDLLFPDELCNLCFSRCVKTVMNTRIPVSSRVNKLGTEGGKRFNQ